MVPRESEDNAYTNLWDDRQGALLYAMTFAIVVNFKAKSK